jgi:hypothetical protein
MQQILFVQVKAILAVNVTFRSTGLGHHVEAALVSRVFAEIFVSRF